MCVRLGSPFDKGRKENDKKKKKKKKKEEKERKNERKKERKKEKSFIFTSKSVPSHFRFSADNSQDDLGLLFYREELHGLQSIDGTGSGKKTGK